MTAVATPTSATAVTSTVTPHAAGAALGRRPGGAAVATKAPLVSASAETYLALGVVSIIGLLIMPLPPFLLDGLLALGIALSIIVLLVTLSSRDPLDFSIFPTLLLLITLLRLGLNVSSTRLILSTGSAGHVIEAFGNFVIAGNYIVGLVIFLILVVINFMVITKGAGRIAEVAARFTLDAMPGRQMSIDADLSAGLIDETEARRRREEISRYADFYGAMDGAAKFVRGDAVAGLIITAINLVGGFIIGMTQHGMSASQSLSTYSILSVGDGLVTQIPALIVSTSAGILVTYGSGGRAMAPSLALQLTRDPRAIWTTAGLLALLALVPGLPPFPFLALAAGAAAMARMSSRRKQAKVSATVEEDLVPVSPNAPPPIKDILSIEPLEVEVGYALVPLVDEGQGGDLLTRIAIMRKQLAFELGIMVPPTRIRDNIQLPANQYSIKLRGVPVASGEVLPRQVLALNASGAATPIDGIKTTDPTFGIPALWIAPSRRADAEAAGYAVVEASTVVATHLTDTIRLHAADLLTRQNTRELLDGLRESHPSLVDDVVPGKLSLGAVQRVLQRLLKEGIPVRDLVTILEALSDAADQTKDPDALAEHARRALSGSIVQMLGGSSVPLRAIAVGPRLEAALMQLFSPRPREGQRTIDSAELGAALQSITQLAEASRFDGQIPPLVAPPSLRVGIRRLLEPVLPRLPIISLAELPTTTPIHTIATWELPHAA
jgi:flagellar biosynthesis protein FlhA